MLVGVAFLPLSIPPSGTYLGILHHKQAKLRKDMQHSVSEEETTSKIGPT